VAFQPPKDILLLKHHQVSEPSFYHYMMNSFYVYFKKFYVIKAFVSPIMFQVIYFHDWVWRHILFIISKLF